MQKLIRSLLLGFGSSKSSSPPPAAAASIAGTSEKQPKKRKSSGDKFDMDQCFEVGLKSSERVATKLMEALKKEVNNEVKPAKRMRMFTKWNSRIEDMLIKDISKQYPTHLFITKNRHKNREAVSLTDDPTWFIDPLGSKTNFVHGFPYANINLAFWLLKKPRFGIVWNPLQDECYTTRTGFGSFMNVNTLQVSNCRKLSEALVMCEARTKVTFDSKEIRKIAHQVNELRSLGSSSMSMCMVAQGYADAYIDFNCGSWDLSATMLLVREAGGIVCDPSLKPLDLMSRRVLCAATQELAEELAAVLAFSEEKDAPKLSEVPQLDETVQKLGLGEKRNTKETGKTQSKYQEREGLDKKPKEFSRPRMVYVLPKLTTEFQSPSMKFSGYPKAAPTDRRKFVRSYPTDPNLPGQGSIF
ncbi:inositol monophosphatase 1-like [Drosophila nasuta]|uniref:inositol monophosphatase 1-like n=1 Tax=Drosophila nasuta TaxID=42062 RepID=UPI00295ED89B|nr:inositol monophosphatase 1-like [Drosophila nasuta]